MLALVNRSVAFLISICAMGWGLLLPVPSRGAEFQCPEANVVTICARAPDCAETCNAAAATVAFLAVHGIVASRGLEINLVETLPAGAAAGALGSYSRGEREISVIDLPTLERAAKTVLGLPVDRDLYRSVIAHEVAHAVAAQNFAVARPSWLGQEYVAYVTQLATLPEAKRARLLERHPAATPPMETELNATVLMANPTVFAVKAYRHFSRPENGGRYLRSVLAGKALSDGGN